MKTNSKILWLLVGYFIIILTLFLWVGKVEAIEIYVDADPGADCSGNYSIANRLCNGADGDSYQAILDGIDAMSAGDTVKIRLGSYTGTVHIDPAVLTGTVGNTVTIRAYNGEAVTLTGDVGHTAFRIGNFDEADGEYYIIQGLKLVCGGANNKALTTYNCSNSQFLNNEMTGCDASGVFTDDDNDNNIYRFNYSHDNGIAGGARDHGFYLQDSNSLIEYNLAIDNHDSGIHMWHTSGNSSGNVVRNNIFSGNDVGIGWGKQLGGEVYNNVSYGNTGRGIFIASSRVGNHYFYNNILAENGTHHIYRGSASTNGTYFIDYTVYWAGLTGTDKWYWYPNTYNSFATWKSGTGNDANSLNVNPEFYFPPDDLSLSGISPAIDAGTVLGDAYKGALHPLSSWPDSVSTVDQNTMRDTDNPGTWEIGAFVYYIPAVIPPGSQPVYYVSNDGDNAEDGLSPATAWKTLAYTTANSGTGSVYLERDSTFNELFSILASGISDLWLTFGAYGTGADPIMDGQDTRNFCVEAQDQDYIIIENLNLINAVQHGVQAWTWAGSHTGLIIRNVTTDSNTIDGILVFSGNGTTYSEVSVYNNTSTNNGDDGISFVGSTDPNAIINPQIYNNTISGNSGGYGISCEGCEGGDIYENNLTNSSILGGISLLQDTDIMEVYRNRITDQTGDCFYLGGTPSTGGSILSYNICDNPSSNIIHIDQSHDDVKIYNNIGYSSGESSYKIGTTAQVTGIVITNNITDSSGSDNVHILNSSTITSNYNTWDEGEGFNNGEQRTFAYWQGTLGHDANGLYEDPLFTNAVGSDFTLQSTSPCIDVGTDLGATYDDALDLSSAWPDGVLTVDQDLFGDGWEMGPYISAPYSLSGIVRDYNGIILTVTSYIYAFPATQSDSSLQVRNQQYQRTTTSDSSNGAWSITGLSEIKNLVIFEYFGTYGTQTRIAGAEIMNATE